MTRIQSYQITVPAGTLSTAPQSTHIQFSPGTVTDVDIKVPPGPSGNLAINVNSGGNNYIPVNDASFLFPDNDYLSYALSNAPNSGNWTVVAYNTDVWDHTFYVTFHVEDNLSAPSTPSSSLIGL
jgi:hypothetical protein